MWGELPFHLVGTLRYFGVLVPLARIKAQTLPGRETAGLMYLKYCFQTGEFNPSTLHAALNLVQNIMFWCSIIPWLALLSYMLWVGRAPARNLGIWVLVFVFHWLDLTSGEVLSLGSDSPAEIWESRTGAGFFQVNFL